MFLTKDLLLISKSRSSAHVAFSVKKQVREVEESMAISSSFLCQARAEKVWIAGVSGL
jgi:hypothetical protein